MSIEERVIAGALFDFAGFLTTRPKKTQIGSSADAALMVDMLKEWADARRLSLESAYVCDWRKAIEQAEKQEPVQDAWILVPVTPTNEMTSAMADTLENPDNEKSSWDLAETMWNSMLLKVPAPPQREWVGLTEEEMFSMWLKASKATPKNPSWSRHIRFWKAIEAKLKEKNS